MNYYKSESGEVFAYDDEQVAGGFVLDGLIPMSREEVEAHINPSASPITREKVEQLRLKAYADPVTGSDRYFAEAARMQTMGEEGWEVVRAAGVNRFQEIQEQYKWPE